ncbi:MAG: hypothetical protein FWG68_01895, partial [Defluviitaleaceae bacterium]|nr:hypothetical protein [Defluviitaleaceae bacterium]
MKEQNRGRCPHPQGALPLDPARSAPLDPLKFLMFFGGTLMIYGLNFRWFFRRGRATIYRGRATIYRGRATEDGRPYKMP